jgi:hypothetical protein
MHLVVAPKVSQISQPAPTDVRATFIGASLVVLFADAQHIERVRKEGAGLIPLSPPFHLGEEDTYLLLPDDISEEIVDILRDGDEELLHDALRDGLLVQGTVDKNPRGRGMVLDAELTHSALELVEAEGAYAADVSLSLCNDALRTLNTLGHAQCTTLSALVDEQGLGALLRAHEFVGVSWRPPASSKALLDVAPTYAWAKKLPDGRTGIQLALFQEDDELVALLLPVAIDV